MYTRFFPGICLLIGIAIVLTGCPEPTAPPPDEPRVVDEGQVQEFRSDMESRLDQVESDINQLEQHAADAPEEDRDDYEGTVEDLRSDLQDVRQRLQEPTPESHGDWTSHRDGVLNDVYDLERRLDRNLVEATDTAQELQNTTQERLDRLEQRRQNVAQLDDPNMPWQQSYDEARQDVEERLAEVPELDDDELGNARSDIAGNLETMRSRLEEAEQDMYQRRDREDDPAMRDRDDTTTDPAGPAAPGTTQPGAPGTTTTNGDMDGTADDGTVGQQNNN